MGGVGPRILMSTVECYGTHIPGLHVLQVGVCLWGGGGVPGCCELYMCNVIVLFQDALIMFKI